MMTDQITIIVEMEKSQQQWNLGYKMVQIPPRRLREAGLSGNTPPAHGGLWKPNPYPLTAGPGL